MALKKKVMEFFRYSNLAKKSGAFLSVHRRFTSSQKDLPEQYEPYIEREKQREYTSILKAFASKKSQFLELHRFNPLTISSQRFREWKEKVKREMEIEQQKFVEERHNILGSDLAAAHFIVYRGGKVKFHNSNKWIEMNADKETYPDLPPRFVRNLYLHSIDASNTNIRYEGLINFTNLTRLKWLSFRNCEHVNDWFVDRISGEYSNTLEYLDISGCKNVTENCLTCIYRMQNLKTLIINNNCNTRSFEYMCLLLEDSMPDLSIEGVEYMNIE